MQHQCIPNLSRLKIGKGVKLRKTLILSAHDKIPLKQISYTKQFPALSQIPAEKHFCSWTTQKLQSVVELFELYEKGNSELSFTALAQELQLTKDEIIQAWLDFQKNRNLQGIRRQLVITHPKKHKLKYLQDNLNSYKTATQMQVGKPKKEKQGESQSINQKKQFQFCKFIKKLQPTKTPMYFYHQAPFKSHNKSSKTLFLRCMASRSGVAAWVLNQRVFKQQHFEILMYEMKKKQIFLDSITRKYLILDKRQLTNKTEFCEVIQYHSFDILCLPTGSLQLNPIKKWIISLHDELQSIHQFDFQIFESKLEQILQRHQSHSLYYYVAQFPKELDSILKNNQ